MLTILQNVKGRITFMNFLPIILFAMLLGGDKLSTVKDFLSRVDFSSFAPILKIFGLNNKTIEFLESDQFNQLLSGNLDLKSILPLLTSFFTSQNTSEEAQPKTEEETTPPKDTVSAIKNVAPTEVEETFNVYFS